MQVVANGKPYDVVLGTTLDEFIRSRGLDPRFVVVERNGEPVERSGFAWVELVDGDRLELVRAVAGGGGFGGVARPEGSESWDPGERTPRSTRRARLTRARLYVVTGVRPDVAAFLDAILSAGADVVQLREKDAEAGDLLRWAETFRAAADRHGALFILNDRPDVALAVDADGVHLGQNDLPVPVARRILGPDSIIGLSCHRPEDHDAAPAEADYLTAGPVFETPTKPGRPGVGLGLVRHAAETVDRPWFAIGGIDQTNVGDVIAAGATRIAVVRAVSEAADPADAVRALSRELP